MCSFCSTAMSQRCTPVLSVANEIVTVCLLCFRPFHSCFCAAASSAPNLLCLPTLTVLAREKCVLTLHLMTSVPPNPFPHASWRSLRNIVNGADLFAGLIHTVVQGNGLSVRFLLGTARYRPNNGMDDLKSKPCKNPCHDKRRRTDS